MTKLTRLYRSESGATAAEYALILAIVGSGLAVAAIFLGSTIANSMNYSSSHIVACQDGTC